MPERKIAVGYRQNDALRQSLNALTEAVFGLSFEGWYRAGYWGEGYIPYSVVEGERVVANVSVSPMEFWVRGQRRRYLQLGTVETHPACRGQGLSARLLRRVLADWKGRCDGLFLFANPSVLDFYPKFGFVRAEEQLLFRPLRGAGEGTARPLDTGDPAVQRELFSLAEGAPTGADIWQVGGGPLCLFYALGPLQNGFYRLPRGGVAAATFAGETLTLWQHWGPDSLNEAVAALAGPATRRVELGFWRDRAPGFAPIPCAGEDALFVQGDFDWLPEGRIPLCSHT